MPVASVERLIIAQAPEDVEQARKNLKLALMSGFPEDGDQSSISDAIAHLAKDASPHPYAAAYILRSLVIPNVIPKPNAANQLARHIAAIWEKIAFRFVPVF